MTKLKTVVRVIGLVFAAGVLVPGAALAGKLYKWVDENGVTHYGDAIPPEYSKQTHDVLNEQGRKVGTVNRARSSALRKTQSQSVWRERRNPSRAKIDTRR